MKSHFSDIGIACACVLQHMKNVDRACVRRGQKMMMIVCIRFTNETVAARDAKEKFARGNGYTQHTATDKEVKGDECVLHT